MTEVRSIVLAAGFGTRLRPLTEWIPKPLMPLGNVPLLGHILDSIAAADISNIAVNAHHLGNKILNFVQAPVYRNIVTPFPEDEILGTGGPLVNAREFLSQADCFVLHNGDILTNLDVGKLVEAHVNGSQAVTMVLLDGPENKLDVSVAPDGTAVVNDILGKLGRGKPDDRTFTYAGIAVFSPEIFEYLPADPEFCSVITAILKLMESRPDAVAGFIPDDFMWNDLGTVEAFLDANSRLSNSSFLRPSSQMTGFEFGRLAEQGSNREFYRIGAGGETRILMRSSEDDNDFDRFNEYGSLFGVSDLPTPRLFGWNDANYTVLMEDLGTTTLHDFVTSSPSPIKLKLTYGSVVETLIDFQLRGGDAMSRAGLEVREFDYDYLRWETTYFKTRYLEGRLGFGEAMTETLEQELDQLAVEALALPKLLLHRDFQSQNVMVAGDDVRLVDFQGCRMGPYTYDLASLVWDPYVNLSSDLRMGLLDLYRRRIVGTGAVNIHPADFGEHVRIAALQRLMQALGAYGFLSQVKGKMHYLQFIEPALDSLRAHLKGPGDFPNLKRLVNRAIEAEKEAAEAGDLIPSDG